MSDKKWARNASPFLVVYSILAAIASVVLTTVLAAGSDSSLKDYWELTVLPLAVSIFLFIYSGEKIVDAMDEDDVYKYVSLLNVYNLAVVLLFFGLIGTIYFRYLYSPGWGWGQIWTRIAAFAVFLAFAGHWLGHIRWLFRTSSKDFESYIAELEERIEVTEKNRQGGFRLFMWSRKHLATADRVIEFKELWYQLQSSTIAGIGLFSAKNYAIGEFIAEGINESDLADLIKWRDTGNFSKSIMEKINQFCIGTSVGFVPPPENDFNQLTPDWYMNHSCHGNVGFDMKGNFIAIRPIQSGEELTYDYGLAESNPIFRLECNCGADNCRMIITGNDWKNPIFRADHLQIMHPSLR